MISPRTALPWVASALALSLAACSSSNSSSPFDPGDGNPPPSSDSTFIAAKLLAPNQSTPIANATIYQADPGSARAKDLVVGIDCPQPSAAATFATCSDGEGNFVLEVDPQAGTVTITVEKGAFRQTFEVAIEEGGSAETPIEIPPLALGSTPETGAPRIAIVEGSFDNIEGVVEDIGFEFDQIRGSNDTITLFTPDSSQTLTDYDIVFINCGAPTVVDDSVEGEARRDYLRSYVEGGGRIYVTDLAADYIIETFPEVVEFAGSGPSGSEIDATVKLEILQTYLDGRSCSDGSGNVPCRNEDGTVDISGFLSGWQVIEGATADFQDVVTFYTEGEVTYSSSTTGSNVTGVKPLNFAFPIGAGNVVYSSYHTVSGEAIGRPQERVLEFLVFE